MSPGSESQARRIATRLTPSTQDRQTLSQLPVDPATQADDHYDYSRVVVRKPWGYEYLIFQNEHLAIWVLHLKRGYQTSLHCHPRKKTSITVLSGEAICSTLEDELIRHAGDMMLIGEGVFHRTSAVSEDGVLLMEIESPVNKRDLVRFRDDYGREQMGYESADQITRSLQNYNYTSLIDPQVYYNVKKRFGRCTIQLARCRDISELTAMFLSQPGDVATILKGALTSNTSGLRFTVGDLIVAEDLRSESLNLDGTLELILVSNTDTDIRVSDFIVAHLKRQGLTTYFLVPGSSSVHLVDAIGRDPDVQSICVQTEQAATLAAEAFAKLAGVPGVVVLASGSSASSALTGVAGSWVDSTPMLVISGQSRPSSLGVPGAEDLRQLANKELNIIDVVRPITKAAEVVSDPLTVRTEIDRAVRAANESRRGPVWLDIPIDVLGKRVDERTLKADPAGSTAKVKSGSARAFAPTVLGLLKASTRPVILAGHGIRAAGAEAEFLQLADALQIPVLTSRRGADLLPEDYKFFFGRPGTYGQRAANFVIQNCDLLLTIGARLSLPLIGRNHAAFARAATKIIVDVDEAELRKSTIQADVPIQEDAGTFIKAMLGIAERVARPDWLAACAQWRANYPPSREYANNEQGGINPYFFVDTLSEQLDEDDVVVVDGGHSLDYVMQAFKLKRQQRIISSPGLEHPGFALPGGIGAALAAAPRQRVVCLCEKKGLQLNISELETIANLNLPLKIFAFNGHGNFSVQRIQAAYFGGRYVGSTNSGVVGSLDMGKLGEAYRLQTATIKDRPSAGRQIADILSAKKPVLAEVLLPDGHQIVPRVTLTVTQDGRWSARPIEDMYPYLDRAEFKSAMIVEPIEES